VAKGEDLVVKVYRLSQQGQLSKHWGIRDQLQRAVVSIPANISEGYERAGRKEYIHFLTIAKGSSGELRCLLIAATRLKYFSDQDSNDAINDPREVSKMLKGLINSLQV
jgi:four helix bundle protein